MKLNDTLSGLLLLVLAIAVLFNTAAYPAIPGQQIGPAVFPRLIALALAACALLLIVRGRGAPGEPWIVLGAWLRSPYHRRNFLVTIGCLVFYLLAAEKLGFLPTGVLILSVMFWALSVPRARILPLALLITLLIHTVFYKALRVPLPWGVLQPWQW
jgi:putative tricarboxylic transport membrane protein